MDIDISEDSEVSFLIRSVSFLTVHWLPLVNGQCITIENVCKCTWCNFWF